LILDADPDFDPSLFSETVVEAESVGAVEGLRIELL